MAPAAENLIPKAGNNLNAGCVVIGRNEGKRLIACLDSLNKQGVPIIYVDSGSSDDSVAQAQKFDATVVELDMSKPFTAARARNAGFRKLVETVPATEYVQFVDGDCKVAAEWIQTAIAYIEQEPSTAIVFGHRRELRPGDSIFNALCDIEWARSMGDVRECGGDFLIRSSVFTDIGGFHDTLIAGEDPELCYRVKRAGWSIVKLDKSMTYHDANILHFSQWARRTVRAGYAYAARAYMHAADRSYYCARENFRILFWALLIPLGALMGALLGFPYALLLLLLYPYQLMSIFLKSSTEIGSTRLRVWHAFYQLLGKFFEFFGQLQFAYRRLNGAPETLIEYK